MKDVNEYDPCGAPWAEPRDYMPPYGAPIPAGVVPPVTTQEAPNVMRLGSFRAAPAGSSKALIAEAVGFLAIARDMLALGKYTTAGDARGPGGFECHPLDAQAEAWSMTGALFRAMRGGSIPLGSSRDIAWKALSQSIRERHSISIGWFSSKSGDASACVAEFQAAIDLLAGRIGQ